MMSTIIIDGELCNQWLYPNILDPEAQVVDPPITAYGSRHLMSWTCQEGFLVNDLAIGNRESIF